MKLYLVNEIVRKKKEKKKRKEKIWWRNYKINEKKADGDFFCHVSADWSLKYRHAF